jgi:hypothetical protein
MTCPLHSFAAANPLDVEWGSLIDYFCDRGQAIFWAQ